MLLLNTIHVLAVETRRSTDFCFVLTEYGRQTSPVWPAPSPWDHLFLSSVCDIFSWCWCYFEAVRTLSNLNFTFWIHLTKSLFRKMLHSYASKAICNCKSLLKTPFNMTAKSARVNGPSIRVSRLFRPPTRTSLSGLKPTCHSRRSAIVFRSLRTTMTSPKLSKGVLEVRRQSPLRVTLTIC